MPKQMIIEMMLNETDLMILDEALKIAYKHLDWDTLPPDLKPDYQELQERVMYELELF